VELDAQFLEQTPQERMFRADADYYVLARSNMPLAELDNHLAAVDRLGVNVVLTGW
jgi:hypothetical protein